MICNSLIKHEDWSSSHCQAASCFNLVLKNCDMAFRISNHEFVGYANGYLRWSENVRLLDYKNSMKELLTSWLRSSFWYFVSVSICCATWNNQTSQVWLLNPRANPVHIARSYKPSSKSSISSATYKVHLLTCWPMGALWWVSSSLDLST